MVLWVAKATMRIFCTKNKGFSLVEILIVIALVAVIFMVAPRMMPGARRHLESALSDLQNAVRFAQDEATLKNQTVRLLIDLEQEKKSFQVEFAPNSVSNFSPISDRASRKMQELQKEKEANRERSFQPIESFQSIKRDLHPAVDLVGISPQGFKSPIVSGKVSIYFFPSGEHDMARLFFSTQDEVVAATIEPFRTEVSSDYYTIPQTMSYDQALSFFLDKSSQEWANQ